MNDLGDAIQAHFLAGRERQRTQREQMLRAFQPDPTLERLAAQVDEHTSRTGAPPHLPSMEAARLNAYRNRKAEAAAFAAEHPTDPDDAA